MVLFRSLYLTLRAGDHTAAPPAPHRPAGRAVRRTPALARRRRAALPFPCSARAPASGAASCSTAGSALGGDGGGDGRAAVAAAPQEFRWVESIELGLDDYAEREARALAWLARNAPLGRPCSVQLGLVCLRGGRLDVRSTAQVR